MTPMPDVLVRGRMDMRPYSNKNIVIIKEMNKYKIVYFGDNGIAVNENLTKCFGIIISYRKISKYFSLKDIQDIGVKRHGIKNRLFINDKVALTWHTVGRNSFSYQKMNKLVNECRRKVSILRLNPVD